MRPTLRPTLRHLTCLTPLITPVLASAPVTSNYPLALFLSSLAGASTGLGGLLMVLQNDLSYHALGLWQGAAAGFMLAVSLFDLIPASLADLDTFPAFVFFIIGASLFLLLKQYIPEPDLDAYVKGADKETKDILWSGIMTAAGISLHNFPEGIAVCVASLRGLRFGLPLALAIGLHNIPEGMAVALPLYFATRRKGYAVRMAFWSGMAEPMGVLFVLAVMQVTGEVGRQSVAAMMSAVAGVMVVISLVELVPQAIRHGGGGGWWALGGGLVGMGGVMRVVESLGLGV